MYFYISIVIFPCIFTIVMYNKNMETDFIKRLLTVPDRSFFLFGPRGVGKSTWLRSVLPDAFFVDLLDASTYFHLLREPHGLEALIGKRPIGSWIVLDEIQKIPMLLDEVHRLMELYKWKFALSGSSARKLKRSGINLLAGRAITRNLGPFSFAELHGRFDLNTALAWGSFPSIVMDIGSAADILNAYVNTYIKEEIREEGIVRKEAPFLRFLSIAGMLNGQAVNGQNVASEAGVPRSSVDVYFSILIDTLLGYFLPAWQPKLKMRERAHAKFYWCDPGIARAAGGLLFDPIDRLWKGCALETLLFHELRTYNELYQKHRFLSYYRTASGSEIDFVIETKKRTTIEPSHIVCIEVKIADRWDRKWERPIRDVSAEPGVKVDKMFGVYTGEKSFHYDEFDVFPVESFFKRLYQGKIF